jgi:hypothetical protein
LVNSNGRITAESLSIKGLGAIYNSDNAEISAKNDLHIDTFGRILNHFRATISGADVFLSSSSNVMNLHSGLLDGKLHIKCNGFENGVGAKITGSLQLSSDETIYNSGEISLGDEASTFTSESDIVNSGVIASAKDLTFKVTKQESNLHNNGGRICAVTSIDLSGVKEVINKSDSSIESQSGNVLFADVVTLYNKGLISSENIVINSMNPWEIEGIITENKGILNARNLCSIGGNFPISAFGETVNAREFIYSSGHNEKTEISSIISGIDSASITAQKVTLNFPNALLTNSMKTIIPFEFVINSFAFINHDIFRCTGGLAISTESDFINGSEDFGEETSFSLSSDSDINPDLKLSDNKPTHLAQLLGGCEIGMSKISKPVKSIISCSGNLEIKSKTEIRNTGTVETKQHLFLKSPLIRHGWAHEVRKHQSLPNGRSAGQDFIFDYDYMESQPSFIYADGGMTVDAPEFWNTFGIIDICGEFQSRNDISFLNYAGKINIHGNAKITTPSFVHTLGKIRTGCKNMEHYSIEFSSTDQPIINVFDGALKINAPFVRNNGGYLYAANGAYLNGARQNLGAVNELQNLSGGFRYGMRFLVNEWNRGYYSGKVSGIDLTRTGNGAVIYAELNETVQLSTLPAVISTAKEIQAQGFNQINNTGTIDGPRIFMQSRTGGILHGYTGEAQFHAPKELARTISLENHVKFLAQRQLLSQAGEGDFFFKSRESDLKIPFTIIDDGTTDLTDIRLPFSLRVLEIMLMEQTQTSLGTGYLPDMNTFLKAAEKARDNSMSARKINRDALSHLKDYTNEDVTIVPQGNATAGLFFKPVKFGTETLLFPELFLSPDSIHAALTTPTGVIVARGSADSKVFLDTEGFLQVSSALHSDGNMELRAGMGALFETTAYSAMAVTQNDVCQSSGWGPFRRNKRVTMTEWHEIRKARTPTIISANGNLSIVIPNDQIAELKGVIVKTGGKFNADGGKFKLTPLELNSVVSCPQIAKYSRISTVFPTFMQTLIQSGGNASFHARLLENNGGIIQSLGTIDITVDEFRQSALMREFTLAGGMDASSGWFKHKESSRLIRDIVMQVPSTEAVEGISINARQTTVEGILRTKGDIRIAGELAELRGVLGYGTEEFHARAGSWFSTAQSSRKSTFMRFSPCVIAAEGDFISDLQNELLLRSVDINCRNARLKAGSVRFSPLFGTERVEISQSTQGFDFFIPMQVYAAECDGNINSAIDAFWRQSTFLLSSHSLLHSGKGADIASNGISTALSAYSALETLNKAVPNPTVPGQYSLAQGLASLFGVGNFGFHKSQSRMVSTKNFSIESSLIAEQNVTVEATIGDIDIMHLMAQAGGDQSYTAAGNIKIRPGEERTETTTYFSSGGASFNIFTYSGNAYANGSDGHSEDVRFIPSQFKSGGTNLFRAGKDIYILIPQIEGQRNVFDAMMVKLENQADEHHETHSSAGVGISGGISGAPMASANFGSGGAHDTFLNDAFIRGDVDFSHSEVLNQGCCVMNVTNQGASYQYLPLNETHQSRNFAIGFSGLDLSSPDAFAYTLGRSILSSMASAGVGMLASEAGLGGFVSSVAASLAGAYINAEVMPQISDETHRPTGLGSTGYVEFERNSHGFHAIGVDFDEKAFRATLDEVKSKIFEKGLERNTPPEDVMQLTQEVESDFGEVQTKIETLDQKVSEIDLQSKAETQSQIFDVPDDVPMVVKRQTGRRNLEVLSRDVRKNAQAKLDAVNETIQIVEVKKQKLSQKLAPISDRENPFSAEKIMSTAYDSVLEGLNDLRNAYLELKKDPVGSLQRVYRGATQFVEDGARGAKIALEHSDITVNMLIDTGANFLRGTRELVGEGLQGLILSCQHPEIFRRVVAENPQQLFTEILHDPALDAVEHLPGIGGLLEGARDLERIHSGLRELRPTVDKWRNIGFFGLLMGKNARSAAGELVESVAKIENKIHVRLTPYGGPGGGHHIDMKSAFKSHPLYDYKKALCLSNEEMARLGIKHKLVNTAQRQLCGELIRSGKPMTRDALMNISVEALVAGGADRQLARDIVARSWWDLRSKDVRMPTDMPWSKK